MLTTVYSEATLSIIQNNTHTIDLHPEYNQLNNKINIDFDNFFNNYSSTMSSYEEYMFEKKLFNEKENDNYIIPRYIKKTISVDFKVMNIKKKKNICYFD